MRLSTRLTTAMLAHAFITVVMLAAVNYRVLEAVNVAGGMQGWEAAGLPMITDSGAEPFVA